MEKSKNAGRFSSEDVNAIVYHEIGKYWMCNICQMQVRIGAIRSHIDGALHQSLKTNYTAPSGGDLHKVGQKVVEKTSGDQQNRSMAKTEVKESRKTSTDAVSSTVANDDSRLDFLAENIVLCKNKTSGYSCFTCNIIITGEQKNVLEHINGKLHQKCKSIMSSDYCKICLTNHPYGKHTLSVFDRVKETEKNTAQTTVDQSQFASERVFSESKGWNCHICRVAVAGTEKNVIEHINGKQHQFNRNTPCVPKSFWYCNICRTNHPLGQKSCSQSVFGIIDETNKNAEKVDNPRKRKRQRMVESEKSTFSEENQPKQSNSKVRLILDAVSLSNGNSTGGLFCREENFMARYNANQNRASAHLRCNFCNKISESQLLCQIHQFSSHPVESAALKEILNSRK